MLFSLHIENIAVIEKSDIEFGKGLNVLTGETGAGKSIVIDAIGMVLGFRVSKELIRSGAEYAFVSAEFEQADAALLEENGIDAEEGENLLLSRRIGLDGKNTCRINGRPVTVAQLRAVGSELLDIHGQNDGLHLLNEAFHRDYLDGFARDDELMSHFVQEYDALSEIDKKIEALAMDEGEKERRLDVLHFQIAELERAELVSGEEDALEERRDILKNAGKLTESLEEAFTALYGSENSEGAISSLITAENGLSTAARILPELEGLLKETEELRYSLYDVSERIRDIKEGFGFSEREQDEVEERLALIKRLGRKYGGGSAELLDYLEQCRIELDNIEFSAEKAEKLSRERAVQLEKAGKAARALSQARKAAAKQLEVRICGELAKLSMPGVKFCVSFSEKANEYGFDRTGCDEVRFLMSANAGEEPGRLSRIASGGELSRIMLAMKNVFAENEKIGTMIFDEIDTGVSGIAAQRVGEKLYELSVKRQLLCVTHLPQIAVMADTHFLISKSEIQGRTYTEVSGLDAQQRSREIARMIGGENITELTLNAAAEQIAAADAYKASLSYTET